jgi:hypothetical protein
VLELVKNSHFIGSILCEFQHLRTLVAPFFYFPTLHTKDYFSPKGVITHLRIQNENMLLALRGQVTHLQHIRLQNAKVTGIYHRLNSRRFFFAKIGGNSTF